MQQGYVILDSGPCVSRQNAVLWPRWVHASRLQYPVLESSTLCPYAPPVRVMAAFCGCLRGGNMAQAENPMAWALGRRHGIPKRGSGFGSRLASHERPPSLGTEAAEREGSPSHSQPFGASAPPGPPYRGGWRAPKGRGVVEQEPPSPPQTSPWSSIESATLTKPPMLAPLT